MLITGVIDGPLSGGIPKAIELYVTADIADLSIYGVGSANNGGGTDGAEFTFPSDSVSEGDFIYVASETPGFNNFFGFNPVYTSSAASINGDDAIELFENGSVIDTFGDVNTDGTGELWEYLDGWAYRNSGTTAGAFDVSDWSFSGPNALDGESTNAAATSPFPIGTYAPTNTITTTTTSTTPPPPVVTIMEIQAEYAKQLFSCIFAAMWLRRSLLLSSATTANKFLYPSLWRVTLSPWYHLSSGKV